MRVESWWRCWKILKYDEYVTKIQCPGYPSFKVLCSGVLLNKAQAHMS